MQKVDCNLEKGGKWQNGREVILSERQVADFNGKPLLNESPDAIQGSAGSKD